MIATIQETGLRIGGRLNGARLYISTILINGVVAHGLTKFGLIIDSFTLTPFSAVSCYRITGA